MTEEVTVTTDDGSSGGDSAEAAAEAAEAVAEAAEAVADAAEAVADAAGDGAADVELHERVTLMEERLSTHDHPSPSYEDVERIASNAAEAKIWEVAAALAPQIETAVEDAVEEAVEPSADDEVTIVEPDVTDEPVRRSFWQKVW